ncbi:unnamed protein product, partial [Brassica oleracea var. botrytis]
VGKLVDQSGNPCLALCKAPYVAKADKRKVEYKTNMEAYNKELICFGFE